MIHRLFCLACIMIWNPLELYAKLSKNILHKELKKLALLFVGTTAWSSTVAVFLSWSMASPQTP